MSKYKSKKVTVNGITFDSKKEGNRYLELTLLEKAGKIKDLKCQVKYVLIPSQKIDGKVVERPCTYVADFVYTQGDDVIVEDVKGYRKGTAYSVFTIKRKLLLKEHGLRIKEI